jgi:isoleucyl-tRNA synthetase
LSKEFKEVKPQVNFPAVEEEILSLWKEQEIFAKTLQKDAPKGNFVFLEGPPSANAKPGLHHILARSFKDIAARYKTMQGFHVDRKAGWDTHGLPVEIAVEKSLNISGKPQIENIVPGDKRASIEKFNALARETVLVYQDEWEKLTERMGFWLDMEHPYVTYHSDYVESLWWVIKQIDEKGFLDLGHKVLPYCPRCGTALSSHEVAQGYQDVTDKSVYVKFELKDEPGTFLVAWTTTPWTLPGNVALAVGEKIAYVQVAFEGQKLILAKELAAKVLPEAVIEKEIKASDLIGKEYMPLFEGVDLGQTADKKAYYVLPASFVTTEDGTGIVHTAVMYGEDDYELGKQYDLPQVHTVDENGNFNQLVPKFQGEPAKDPRTEALIINYLKEKGLLLKEEKYLHSYPFCWRCGHALLYYARSSWFVLMSKLRNELLANNEKINWIPEHIKEGRFGEWLREVKDWAFSRDRYWGTPLPIWIANDDPSDRIVVGSFDELRSLAKDPKLVGTDFDPHRPFIDDIELIRDGKTYVRVPQVADVWFDSGSAPFAQWHYPFENSEKIDKGEAYPADYISEAIDQTRGWFYTLLAVSTLLAKEPACKNVVVLGHIRDKQGKKMSKSVGNVVDPWEVANSVGMDAVRWYFFSLNDPGEYKNFDLDGIKEYIRKVFITTWNSYSFFVTYAKIDNYQPEPLPAKLENPLDNWLVARLNQTVSVATEALDKFDYLKSAREIEEFIDDLSNWYIRRSRRRFWKSESDTDKAQAYATLYHTLMTLTKLMSPFAPFIPEAIYQNLKIDTDPESVHLSIWPEAGSVDEALIKDMAKVRELVEAGLRLRDEAKLKIRQPLASFTIDTTLDAGLKELIADELNVKEVKDGKTISLDTKLTDELMREGMMRETVRAIQAARKNSGFAVTDRIELQWYSSESSAKEMFETFVETIANEVLADKVEMAAAALSDTVKFDQGELTFAINVIS